MKTFKYAKNPITPYKKSISQNKKINHANINKIISQYKSENMLKKKKKRINNCPIKNNFNTIFNIEKMIYSSFKKTYSNDKDFYNIKIINDIITNENSHAVAEFKDYLIKGDDSEFLQRLYLLKESIDLIPKISEYYENCSIIFPNYVILPESKYIYKNIQRKQRIIDHQQDINDELKKKNFKKKEIKSLKNKNDNDDIVFDDKVIDSILNQTDTSNMKKIFGLNNNESDSSNNFTMDKILLMIDKAENEIINLNNKKIKIQNKKNNVKNYIRNNNNKNKGRNSKRNLHEELLNVSSKDSYFNKNNNCLNSKININHNKILSTIDIEKKYNNTINASPIKIKEKKILNKHLLNTLLSKNIFNTYNNSFMPLESETKNIDQSYKKSISPSFNNNLKFPSKTLLKSSSSSNNIKKTKTNKKNYSKVTELNMNSIKIKKKIPLSERESNQYKYTIEPEIIEMTRTKTQISRNFDCKNEIKYSNSINRKNNLNSKNKENKLKNSNKKLSIKNKMMNSYNHKNFISVTQRNNSSSNKNNHLITISNINNSRNYFDDNEFNEFFYEYFPTDRTYINKNHYSNNKKSKRKIISNTILPLTKRDEESIKGIKINGFDEILRKSRNSNAISERIDNSNNNSSSLVKTNRTTISNKSNIRNYISVERRKINNH